MSTRRRTNLARPQAPSSKHNGQVDRGTAAEEPSLSRDGKTIRAVAVLVLDEVVVVLVVDVVVVLVVHVVLVVDEVVDVVLVVDVEEDVVLVVDDVLVDDVVVVLVVDDVLVDQC